MGIISLGSNTAALRALNYLSRTSSALADGFGRLASGLRINRASDDAAGLAVAAGLNNDSRVYSQAVRNGNDAISALGLANDTLTSASDILIRMRELATQAANGSLSRTQRLSLDAEGSALTQEFTRLTGSVSFNGQNLLNGQFGKLNIQLGYGNNGLISSNLGQDLSRKIGLGYAVTSSQGGPFASTSDVISQDFNNDGKIDLVQHDALDGVFQIQLGNGDGTFTSAKLYNNSNGNSTSIISSDVNSDGKLDILLGDAASPGVINIFLGNGDGTFQGERDATISGGLIVRLAAGDVNGDGKVDLVSTFGLSTNAYVSLGNGDGSFASPTSAFISSNASNALRLADLNGDGKDDLISSNGLGANVSVLFADGKGGLGAAQNYALTASVTTIQIADLNYDGIFDIVAGGGNTLSISLGNSNGTFKAFTATTATSISRVQVGDTDGDGIPDIAWSKTGTVNVLKGNGDGTFRTASAYGLSNAAGEVSLADFNGDGVNDVAITGSAGIDAKVCLASTTDTTTLQRINLTTASMARAALSTIDSALTRVQNELGTIGSTQSRVLSALNAVSAIRDNSQNAVSRITDVDVASESASLLKNQILQQSQSAILAHANQQPALALSLLKAI